MLLHMMGDIRSIYISDYTHTWWGFRSWMWMCADRIMIIWNLTWVFFCWISCYISLWCRRQFESASQHLSVWNLHNFPTSKQTVLRTVCGDKKQMFLTECWAIGSHVRARVFNETAGLVAVLVATRTVFLKPNHEVFRSLTKCFLCLHLSVVVECSLHLSAEYLIFFIFIQNQTLSTLNTYILTFITNMWNNYFIFFLIYVSLTHTWSINLSLCTFLLNLCPANTCIYFLLWLTTRQTKDEPLTPNF